MNVKHVYNVTYTGLIQLSESETILIVAFSGLFVNNIGTSLSKSHYSRPSH